MRTIENISPGLSVLLLFLLLLGLPATAQEPKFPDWSTKVQTWDAAGILTPDAKKRIAKVQQSLKSDHGVGLWVVLLDGQKRYTAHPGSIESFALSLARQKVRPLAGNDDFIVLLVCKEDRKSRIELGPNWANRWNDSCNLITQQALVPHFKAGDYEQGVVTAVESLGTLVHARKGELLERARDASAKLGRPYTEYTFLQAEMIPPAVLMGAFLMIVSIFSAKVRLLAFGASLLFFALAFFSKVVAAFAVLGLLISAPFLFIGNLVSTLRSGGGSRGSSWDSSSSYDSGSSYSSSYDSGSSYSSGSDSGGGSTGSW